MAILPARDVLSADCCRSSPMWYVIFRSKASRVAEPSEYLQTLTRESSGTTTAGGKCFSQLLLNTETIRQSVQFRRLHRHSHRPRAKHRKTRLTVWRPTANSSRSRPTKSLQKSASQLHLLPADDRAHQITRPVHRPAPHAVNLCSQGTGESQQPLDPSGILHSEGIHLFSATGLVPVVQRLFALLL